MLTHAHCHRRNAIFPPMAQRFHAARQGMGGAIFEDIGRRRGERLSNADIARHRHTRCLPGGSA
ncbi:hypothetical protein XFF6166_10087 [Xanthomonas citri pv. fuscans]|nr:hypothetical protein XFF6166_10087 [Xanthomonas citri pv. fuscans]SOO29396.1 hypothetical protein XAP6164_3310002 [Xanthomonas phaseoli pv. phaseoli]SOO02301.1 hypothetical protein XFF6960_590116 [Xanthomonas citri pv. fuscans]SOO06679.1 hypothetical protein XFF7767_80088 [Xanthomonas citri pv. fuscans]SOO11198.1 hypothetical protein XFF6970_70128 [Xanthomonas citri pv. fuscans]